MPSRQEIQCLPNSGSGSHSVVHPRCVTVDLCRTSRQIVLKRPGLPCGAREFGAVNDALLWLEELRFLSDHEVAVTSAEEDGEAIWIGVIRRSAGAERPDSGRWSTRIHGSYLRFPADLPSTGGVWCGACRSVGSPAVPPRADGRGSLSSPGADPPPWQIDRAPRSALAEVGPTLAGRAGGLAKILGVSVSRGTVLRLVEAMRVSPPVLSASAVRPAWFPGHAGAGSRSWCSPGPKGYGFADRTAKSTELHCGQQLAGAREAGGEVVPANAPSGMRSASRSRCRTWSTSRMCPVPRTGRNIQEMCAVSSGRA